jgi:hypothetical protein
MLQLELEVTKNQGLFNRKLESIWLENKKRTKIVPLIKKPQIKYSPIFEIKNNQNLTKSQPFKNVRNRNEHHINTYLLTPYIDSHLGMQKGNKKGLQNNYQIGTLAVIQLWRIVLHP